MSLERRASGPRLESFDDVSEPAQLCQKARDLLAVARPLQEPGRDELVRLVDEVWAFGEDLENDVELLALKNKTGKDLWDVENSIPRHMSKLREKMKLLQMWVRGYQQGFESRQSH
jgi:hypothetical protein